MELITFKTNIKNEAAVCRVASQLNPVVGAANWQLDMSSSGRFLTVYSPGKINETQVRAAIRKAGFRAESVENIYSIY